MQYCRMHFDFLHLQSRDASLCGGGRALLGGCGGVALVESIESRRSSSASESFSRSRMASSWSNMSDAAREEERCRIPRPHSWGVAVAEGVMSSFVSSFRRVCALLPLSPVSAATENPAIGSFLALPASLLHALLPREPGSLLLKDPKAPTVTG
eukprot:CAMPEP_0206219010 /NCGR_PEP_ID=MMETSP0047_2-20121206/4097_1 /ASSEMBLY_ACC=CAM_ASM_000192 /TAXON_ID=195065 /ORGANISM="Chroomonas mesostigmatica_cf, Strain CCMP1168" /LENGTH=153 /DNA_ID=CAMNT_0053641537 /DNA_START=131 /DNA_END=588 /DNA_ORIENTATION=+